MKSRILLSVLTGAMLATAYAPVSLGWAAWFALVPLFLALHGVGTSKGFLLGWICGFVYFLGTVYWVVHSMYVYGAVPLWISVCLMLLLAITLALYPAIFALGFSLAKRITPALRVLVLPSMWVGMEYLMGHLFTGFPWVVLGYTQSKYLPVIQVADITGVWGVSFLVVMVNAALFLAIDCLRNRKIEGFLAQGAIGAVVLTSVFVYGFMRIEQVEEQSSEWRHLRVGVVQGNIEQDLKWDPAFRDSTIDTYRRLSRIAAATGAELIVWPETATPFYLEHNRVLGPRVLNVANETKSYILTGSPYHRFERSSGKFKYFNSAYLLSPAGRIVDRYDKVHLVPFGEYVPLKRFLPFVKGLAAAIGDFTPGPQPNALRFNGVEAGVLICFESIFPELSRELVKRGAAVLVNITNDAWFGATSAPFQHFEMSVLRAVENRISVLRSANTGISGLIGPTGKVVARSRLFTEEVLIEEMPLRHVAPGFYSRYGDVFAIGCLAVWGFSFIVVRMRPKHH